MSERGGGSGLRILLLLGELHLRHGRDARNLRALPPHGCYLQHRGGELKVLFDQLEKLVDELAVDETSCSNSPR